MNVVVLQGRTTREPEVRYSGDMAISRITLAVERVKKGGTKEVDFINVVAFGKTAEVMEKHVGKGARIVVNGSIKVGSYEKDGRKVTTFDVIANNIDIIDFKKKEEKQEVTDGFEPLDDDDIPF